ncbi:MAG: MFS transporter [Cytophagaceae bacterium]|jgi:FSR family fosmidomycin resistance protein-like MFS transporter|nr:MFS transporter [Cytophagaceae bacterium]
MERTSSTSHITYSILLSLSLAHFMNDAFQSVLSAVYPILKNNLLLTFTQVGLITLVYQICASVFQPVFGFMFDKKPSTWYLVAGSASTCIGLFLLAYANSLFSVLVSVSFIGLGSSVIHPEASRLTHLASGGRHGLAQSIFQIGGNLGSSLGPLLAALIIAPYGQKYIAYFVCAAFIAIFLKYPIFKWYSKKLKCIKAGKEQKTVAVRKGYLPRKTVILSLCILLTLIFSKYVYMASLTNFYTFYLIEKFSVSIQHSQFYLFAFLFAMALGTFVGGPVGDRIGRKYVIWASILGVAPFTLLLPHVNLFWTCVLTIFIGFVLSSAFSAILVYAQELLPTKVGLISGLFFGLAFGIAGIAAAVLGNLADQKGIEYVYRICGYLPLLGIVTVFLPNVRFHKK